MRRTGLLVSLLVALAWPAHAQTPLPFSGNINTNGDCLIGVLGGQVSAAIQITGTWTGTLTFSETSDGVTYATATLSKQDATTGSTTTGNGIWTAPNIGLAYVRVCATAAWTGSARIIMQPGMAGAGGGGSGGGGGSVTQGTVPWVTDGSATTQPVSAASLPLPTGASTSANQTTEITALQIIDNLPNTQGSTTSGESGALALGAVTTSAPTYTTAQSNPLSLGTNGGLRVISDTATNFNASVKGGVTNNAGVPATTANLGVLPNVANAAAPTFTETFQTLSSVDLHGATRVLPMTAAGAAQTFATDTTQGGTSSTTGPQGFCNGSSSAPTVVTNGQSQYVWCDLNGRLQIKADSGALASGSIASGAVASGAVASGAIASGAYASGSIGSGAIASGAVASGAYAAGAMAAQSFAVGAIPPAAGTLTSGAITSAMTGTTSTSLIALTASNYIYITNCTTSNGSTTVSTDILLQDGSGGTTIYVLPAPAASVATTGGGGGSFSFPVPLKVPTVGGALFAANVTTSSSTKISCSGFKSTVSY